MTQKGGKGGRASGTHSHGGGVSAEDKRLLAQLRKRREKKQKKKETDKLVRKVAKKARGLPSSDSSSSEESDSDTDDASLSSSDSDARKKKKKKAQKKKQAKKRAKQKKKASTSSSSEAPDSSSKGTEKGTKKRKPSKLSRMHQEIAQLREELEVQQKSSSEFESTIRDEVNKLQQTDLDGKEVLCTPGKDAPATKQDIIDAVLAARDAATKKAEATRPHKGILAWLDEVSGEKAAASKDVAAKPTKEAEKVSAQLREWLTEVRNKEVTALSAANPVLPATAQSLCASISRKVATWYKNPSDLALLKELVQDFELRTQASNPPNIIKAILVALMARGCDFDPEKLLVSKKDILEIMKRERH